MLDYAEFYNPISVLNFIWSWKLRLIWDITFRSRRKIRTACINYTISHWINTLAGHQVSSKCLNSSFFNQHFSSQKILSEYRQVLNIAENVRHTSKFLVSLMDMRRLLNKMYWQKCIVVAYCPEPFLSLSLSTIIV